MGRTDGSGQGAVGRGASHGDVETILLVVVAGVRWRVNTHAVRIFPNSVRVAGVRHARFSETWNDPIGWCRHPVFLVPNQPEMTPYRQFKYNIEQCFQDKNKKQAADHSHSGRALVTQEGSICPHTKVLCDEFADWWL